MFVNYERCVVSRLVRDTDLRDRYSRSWMKS